jgi:hypothetical protein
MQDSLQDTGLGESSVYLHIGASGCKCIHHSVKRERHFSFANHVEKSVDSNLCGTTILVCTIFRRRELYDSSR